MASYQNLTIKAVLKGQGFKPHFLDKLDKDGLIYEHIDTWDREPGEILKQFFRKGEEATQV